MGLTQAEGLDTIVSKNICIKAVQNLLNNQTASNSSKISIPSNDISHIVLPGPGLEEDNDTRCDMERTLLTSMVENVLHVSQVNCRRKKKLIKIWHKPKPGVDGM